MCGRYAIDADIEALIAAFHIAPDRIGPIGALPRYNQSPTDIRPGAPPVVRTAPVIRQVEQDRRLDELIWRFIPRWSHGDFARYSTINAKSETVHQSGMYKAAWHDSQRCLVPVTGVIEWQVQEHGPKQPYHLQMEKGGIFALAGLWEHSVHKNGHCEESFTILTTEANHSFAPIHARMPVIIHPYNYEDWLNCDPETAKAYCLPYEQQPMKAMPIGRGINNPHADSPELLATIDLNNPLQAKTTPQPTRTAGTVETRLIFPDE